MVHQLPAAVCDAALLGVKGSPSQTGRERCNDGLDVCNNSRQTLRPCAILTKIVPKKGMFG